MEALFSDVDILFEILCRLPVIDLSRYKCISKQWNKLISDPYFLLVHHQRSTDVSCLFIQKYMFRAPTHNSYSYCPISLMLSERVYKALLGMNFILTSVSNGLLCCRNHQRTGNDFFVYVVNPASMDWFRISSPEDCCNESLAIAFYPFGYSDNTTPSFKLVNMRRPEGGGSFYYFWVYSSETGTWNKSKEICYCNYDLPKAKKVFANGRFNWLTLGHYVITFDAKEDKSSVIKLPGVEILDPYIIHQMCIGESDGYLYFLYVNWSELKVWSLQDYSGPLWVLKYRVNLFDSFGEYVSVKGLKSWRESECHEEVSNNCWMQPLTHEEVSNNCWMQPLTLNSDVLFLRLEEKWIQCYDFKTGGLESIGCSVSMVQYLDGYHTPAAFPYTITLAAASALKYFISALPDDIASSRSEAEEMDRKFLRDSPTLRPCCFQIYRSSKENAPVLAEFSSRVSKFTAPAKRRK
ncbi:hypothetical protein RJ640_024840 [Escallonia rubra]|uniref:F-box domain-containing protein n=1 Tax=Escallonia rubra TaxID=112253 RepID=A0AA88R6D8_9ASTE|nr:hypothetical protein RJ640_024840 [Escallonia rubra]